MAGANNNKRSEGRSRLGSLLEVADRLVAAVTAIMRTARTEEDLRVGFEKALAPTLEAVGVEPKPRYERHGATAKSIFGGRPDAVHGQVIIEYEPPGSFRSRKVVDHAFDQLVGYLTAEAHENKPDPVALARKLVGVGFDGTKVFFVHYRHPDSRKAAIDPCGFQIEGPYHLDVESARTLLTYMRALARLPLTAERLAERFGPKSKTAPLVVSAFADSLEHWATSPRIQVFFEEWKRLFGIVYGEQFSSWQGEEAKLLSQLYGVGSETDFQQLLFSVHTYFALLMKLIAAELIMLKETPFASSLSQNLTHSFKKKLVEHLTDIEDGGIYARRGITNFLEGDFFRWYLDALSPRLEDALREMARELSEFEPATTTIDPEATRDLLKKLYQYLVPAEIRHRLGEYYTPDWLAELLLDEVGYDGDTRRRFLDPSCGSGTFLVLAIQRARASGAKAGDPPLETVKRIVANIWGFDLNPLAVIASRTNYLFALGDLVDQLPNVEIPVYLADSVLTPTETSGHLFGDFLEVRTSAHDFRIPAIWVRDQGFLLGRAAPLVEEMVKQDYSLDQAMERLKKAGLASPPHEHIVAAFYEELLKLEREGRDGIWVRFLKNAFAPMVGGKFDFVVGNPPWIRWGYLSPEYRKATLPLWRSYGLFSLKGQAARLGGGEKDFSMLFTYAAADYYLAEGGKLGFLITQEVFKSKGAGEGFRRFQLGTKEPLKVLKAHDLASVQPFEGAANKTAAVVLSKGSATTYPVPYMVWSRKRGAGRVPTDATLAQALPLLTKQKLLAHPMGAPTGSWQTLGENDAGLSALEGANPYRARRGASTEPYGVFWLDVQHVLASGEVTVRNLATRGKLSVAAVEENIEPDLIFPAASGADIQRWRCSSSVFVLIVQDPSLKCGYPEATMKKNWPRTYGYLLRFRELLLNRAMYKKYHEGNPFYSQYNIAGYSFAPYRVLWKRMAGDLVAAVVSQQKTQLGFKPVIGTDTTAFFPVDNEDEAHYLCAIVNSQLVREFIKSYSSAGRGFGAPSVMSHVGMPKFDGKNQLHCRLADISKELHKLQADGKADQVAELEQQNDALVKELFQ